MKRPRESRSSFAWTVNDWRNLARAVDLLALLTAVFFLHAFLTNGPATIAAAPVTGRAPLIIGTLLLATAGLGIAWLKARWGGGLALTAGGGLALLVYLVAGRNNALAAFIYGSPFIITGALFLLVARREGRRPAPVTQRIDTSRRR